MAPYGLMMCSSQFLVRYFVNIAAAKTNIPIVWKGTVVDEKGYFDGGCINVVLYYLLHCFNHLGLAL